MHISLFLQQKGEELRSSLSLEEERAVDKDAVLDVGTEVRSKISAAQWQDPELRALLHKLGDQHSAKGLPDSGGGGKVVVVDAATAPGGLLR